MELRIYLQYVEALEQATSDETVLQLAERAMDEFAPGPPLNNLLQLVRRTRTALERPALEQQAR